MRGQLQLVLGAAMLLASRAGVADPPAPPADEGAHAPPGEESGRTDPPPDESALRQVARGALLVPRVAWNAVLFPVRGSIWLFERYELDDLYYRIFFNDARTMGLYPTASYETGFGFTGGGRFVHRDLFGAGEHLALQVATGGRFRQLYSASFRSGERFDRFGVELDVGWERRPHDELFGIGNGDIAAMPPTALIDPRRDATAIETRYRQDHGRVTATTDVRVIDGLHVRPAFAISELSFGPSDSGVPAEMVYDRTGLVGYDGFHLGYGELELRWDGRHRTTTYESDAVKTAGSLVAVFGGRAFDGTVGYWRYGTDLQHFIRLGEGPRVLAGRVHVEGVTGSLDEVPFTELPKLGGSSYLRGYQLDRFRDRVAAVGSVEYQWDLSQFVGASVFADAGRVYRSIDELSAADLRIGFGVAIEAYSDSGFLLCGSLASSVDGGLFLNLSFNPVFDLDERVRRK